MSLILLIIVLSVIFFKRSSENYTRSSSEKIFQEDRIREKEIYNGFCLKYEDDNLEEEIITQISNGDSCVEQMRQAIVNEVGVNPNKNMIIASMMATRGKIPKRYIYNGIGRPNEYFLKNKSNADRQRVIDNQFRFIKWYEIKLKENGMDDSFMIYYVRNMPSLSGTVSNIKKGVSSMTEPPVAGRPPWGGIYCWNKTCEHTRFSSGSPL